MRHDIRTFSTATLVATLVAAAAASGCENRAEQQQRQPERTAPAQETPTTKEAPAVVKVDDVREEPRRFLGKNVRLTGEVDQIFADRAFELEGTGWAFDDNITVLTKTPVQLGGQALEKGDELIVTGVVRLFAVTEVERELGWDMTTEVETELKERPVLIADTIRKIGEYGSWSAAGTPNAKPLPSLVALFTTVDLKTLVDRPIDFGRERVQAVSGKGLWIGPNPQSPVFVLPQQMPADIQVGDTVQVSGTLRMIAKDTSVSWGLPADQVGRVREETLFIDAATVRELPATSTDAATPPAGTQDIRH